MPSQTPSDAKRIDSERQIFRQRIAKAIDEEDDPLALYDQFVQWTIKNYGKHDPNSGLLELLQQATNVFKDDPIYKTDLRYLKLWALYAAQLERPDAIAIYANLLANEIGTSFSILYEGYATLLEADARRKDAESIYRQGIQLQARPLERLKNRYADFQKRSSSSRFLSTPSDPATGSFQGGSLTGGQSRSTSSSSSRKREQVSTLPSLDSTRESRYAAMLAPPDPGKRPEKQRFNFSLLFTREGGEYSIQEARARSIGLLGKKWGPPPISETAGPSSLSIPVDFNDDGLKSTFTSHRKSLMGGAEPTVTINTRAALDDVFGIYNSPDRAVGTGPGSKHAPLKEVKLAVPGPTQITRTPASAFQPFKDGNNYDARTPSAKLTPYIDENQYDARTPSAKLIPFVDENRYDARTPSAKLIPFVDENRYDARTPSAKLLPFIDENIHDARTPLLTPFGDENKASSTRLVLSVKETPAQAQGSENPSQNSKGTRSENLEVFSPAPMMLPPLAPLRDVFTDHHGKPQPKIRPAHERAKSHHDAMSPQLVEPVRPFAPFFDENAKTPFKVFSRPPEQPSNVFTPKTPSATFIPLSDGRPTFTPFRDGAPTFTPFVDPGQEPAPQPLREQSLSNRPLAVDGNDGEGAEPEQYDEVDDQYDEEGEHEREHEQYEAPLANDQDVVYEEGDSYQEIPLGGRFGRFNIMTPITERTFEYTTSTRGGSTPSERLRHAWKDRGIPEHDEQGAVKTAEKLAAELRDIGEEPLQPLTLPSHPPDKNLQPLDYIEEKTAGLSLVDTLTLNSKFKPPNPCNPFDPPIVAGLLSRIASDPYFYDLRDQDSSQLDGLQKFAKKARKTSSGGSTGAMEVSGSLSLVLEGHRFSVSEKLGEGGFAAVFKARDLGSSREDEDSDEDLDDEDDDNVSLVALKVVRPRNIWEYHVLRRLHSTLPVHLRQSVVLPHALYAFRDESFLILDFCSQGTLLNVVNNAVAAGVSQQGACLDELLVVFFTVELLRLLEVMHNAGFIHGDLKIDNCLLRLEDVPGGNSAWSSVYQPSGEGGWSSKGLKVIDFGRTIDTRLFPSGQTFIAEWPTDDRDCFEARENQPWTFQTDYFGLVGIIYCMLFGKYIQGSSVVLVSDRYKISTPLKRYWQTDLWNRLFNILLNPCTIKSDGKLPVSDELGAVRGEMETWLQTNCNRSSITLKGLLKKVEVSCYIR